MKHMMIALAALLAGSAAYSADLVPWYGKVMQIDVQHKGADWVARDVRSLDHASSESGNVQRAFVDVEYVSSEQRKITLTCAGKTLAEQTVTPDFTGVLTGTCYGIKERITLVPLAKARHPRQGTLTADVKPAATSKYQALFIANFANGWCQGKQQSGLTTTAASGVTTQASSPLTKEEESQCAYVKSGLAAKCFERSDCPKYEDWLRIRAKNK